MSSPWRRRYGSVEWMKIAKQRIVLPSILRALRCHPFFRFCFAGVLRVHHHSFQIVTFWVLCCSLVERACKNPVTLFFFILNCAIGRIRSFQSATATHIFDSYSCSKLVPSKSSCRSLVGHWGWALRYAPHLVDCDLYQATSGPRQYTVSHCKDLWLVFKPMKEHPC